MRRTSLVIGVVFLASIAPSTAAARIQVEVTFDDGSDLSTTPELNNLETGSSVKVALSGSARRSALTQGRYGRAAEFPAGQGAILVKGWVPPSEAVMKLWVLARDTATGSLMAHPGSWDLRLENGQLALSLVSTSGQVVVLAQRLAWPTDGAFHHLSVAISSLKGIPTFSVALDFQTPTAFTSNLDPAEVTAPLRFGTGFDGFIDELLVAEGSLVLRSAEQDEFNRNPIACLAGTACKEVVFTMTPRTFDHAIPVRFKAMHDPKLCSASSPCPLLFAINGGEACANDYTPPSDLASMVAQGFVVVTVDPYCEGEGKTGVPETEVPQFIESKNRVFADAALAAVLSSSDYHATGCSHGAEAVILWSLFEVDHPARTFARSGAVGGMCSFAAGKICGKENAFAQVPASTVESEDFKARHLRSDAVMAISRSVAATREIARSWGANLDGPVCTADGGTACTEEGKWAMTYASRRFRDVWEANQNPSNPSGYFVEDRGADCRHCAPPDSEAFRCGMCLTRWGRVAMATQCPDCLTYRDATISRGGEAELCPMSASWYTDAVAVLRANGSADAGAVTPEPPDAGGLRATVDAGSGALPEDGGDRPGDAGAVARAANAGAVDGPPRGCGCTQGGKSFALLSMVMLAWVVSSSWRRQSLLTVRVPTSASSSRSSVGDGRQARG
jgi:hypothetical protein